MRRQENINNHQITGYGDWKMLDDESKIIVVEIEGGGGGRD